jgi:UTP-glucose-1-phosphate uridylyltransferase
VLLEELDEADVEEICLVVGSAEERKVYEDYFKRPLSNEHRGKLSEEKLRYESQILRIGEKLKFRVQNEKRGFGHAVAQAREFAGSEPCLLLLGDTLYTSDKKNCSLQLMEAFEEANGDGAAAGPMVGIRTIPLERCGSYGVLCGEWKNKGRTLLDVQRFVEKPAIDEARNELAMKGADGAAEYYGVFGQYVLTPEVFAELDAAAHKETGEYGEIGVTETLARFIGKGLSAAVIDGETHDMGNVAAYMETFAALGKRNTNTHVLS